MKYSAILHEEADGGSLTPLGVHVIYEEGDHEELEHLLVFLEDHFTIEAEAVPKKQSVKRGLSLLHPYLQLGENDVSLLFLLSLIDDLDELGYNVAVGFLYPGNAYKRRSKDIETFRVYKKHLDETGKDWPILRTMYQRIEDEFFPLGKKLN